MGYPFHVFDVRVVAIALEVKCTFLVSRLSFLCMVLIRRYEKWGYLVVVSACFVAMSMGVVVGELWVRSLVENYAKKNVV